MKFNKGTHVNWSDKSAHGVFSLKGDPAYPEKAQTILEFPGGSIEIARTSEGEYWAHIAVDRDAGHITDGRIDVWNDHASLERGKPLMDPDISHIAIKITPR